jgi:phosphoglycolate phosphatase
MRKHLLFDLDGTLLDPRVGIIGCFRHALEASGRVAPPEDELLWCIGPPLNASFAQMFPEAGEAEVLRLVGLYRERYAVSGMYENTVYDGIPEMLAMLAPAKRIYLATSKPHHFARPILSHFGLASHFTAAHGSELNGTRGDKGELVKYILETEKISAADALLVGDTKFDVIGAKKNGLLAVGITWGYGSRADLEAAGADYIFDTRAELAEFLLR